MNKKEYQLAWMLETESLAMSNMNKVNAEWQSMDLKVIWNYNGVTLSLSEWETSTILAIPSIINLCGTTVEDVVANNYLMYDWFSKFPSDYKWISLYDQCDGSWVPVVNNSDYEVFNWKISDLKWESNNVNRSNLIIALQNAYFGTKFENEDKISSILNINPNWDSEVVSMFTDNLIKSKWSESRTISSWSSSDTTVWWESWWTPSWWMLVDSNCDKSDITIWNQTWAGCNSTIGTWVDFSETNIKSCTEYSTNLAVICDSTENASTAKENAWNSTYWVDNIWLKLYTKTNAASACSTWYHLPTRWEFHRLLENLWCNNINDWVSFNWLDNASCAWLWWSWNASKNSPNNLIKALKLPMSGNWNSSSEFFNRWLMSLLWSSSELPIYAADWMTETWNGVFVLETYTTSNWVLDSFYNVNDWNSYSVRCIKDWAVDSWFFLDSSRAVIRYDITKWNDVVIPTKVNYKNVSWIADYAFYNYGTITSVVIPEWVTSIWTEAFAWNHISSVTLPNTLKTIWDAAFFANHLTSISIPYNVTSIWDAAFDTNKLTSIALWSKVQTIWADAFTGYDDWSNNPWVNWNALTTVVIPDTVTSIWAYAFSDNALSSLTFNWDVATIWDGAFNYQDASAWWTVYGPAAWNVYNTFNVNNYNSVSDEYYFDDLKLTYLAQ